MNAEEKNLSVYVIATFMPAGKENEWADSTSIHKIIIK